MNVAQKDLALSIESKLDRTKWVKWKFSDLVENIVEKVTPKTSGLEDYIGLKHLDTGSLKIRRFGKTSEINGDKLKIYKGDLIFAKRNSYLKRVAIAEHDAVASAHSLVLRAKPENVLPEFLPFFMMSELFWQRAIEISVGSLSPTINWRVLAKQEFLLPPKDQQAQLAELLWAMDGVIEKEEMLSAELKRTFKSYRKQFIEQGDEKSIFNSKKIRFGKVCQHWPTKKLGSISTMIGGNAFKSNKFKDSGKHQVLRIGNLTDSGFNYDKSPVYVDEISNSEEKYLIPKGAVVLSLTGTNGKRDYGFPTLMEEHNTYLLNQRLVMIIPNHDIMTPEFLYLLAKMELFQGRFFLNATGTANQANVSIVDVSEIELPIPPQKIQNQIVQKMNSIRDAISVKELKNSRSKSLQKSLVNQVF